MPLPDLKKCLQVMKTLETENEKLKEKITSYEKENESLKFDLSHIHKKFNDLDAKMSLLSTTSGEVTAPLSQTTTIEDQLTAQNLRLRNELQFSHGEDKVQEVLSKSDLEQKLVQCKATIEQNKKEIAYLKSNKSDSDLAKKLAELHCIIKKTKAVNETYADEVSSLQDQLNKIELGKPKETQAQTVSGDQDANASASHTQSKMQELYTKIHELEVERDELVNEKLILKIEIGNLKKQSTSSTNDFPVDSQMKTFIDDFNDERKEKEEIKVENSRLKEQLSSLYSTLHNPPNSAPPMQSEQSLNQYQQQRSAHVQNPHYDRTLSSQDDKLHFHSASASVDSKQNFTVFDNNSYSTVYNPPLNKQLSARSGSSGDTPSPHEGPHQRRIGFNPPSSPPLYPYSSQVSYATPRPPMPQQARPYPHSQRQAHPINFSYHQGRYDQQYYGQPDTPYPGNQPRMNAENTHPDKQPK